MRIAVIKPLLAETIDLLTQAVGKHHSLELFDDIGGYLRKEGAGCRLAMLQYRGASHHVAEEIRNIRDINSHVLIALLAEGAEESTCVDFLNSGGDECICIPIKLKELRARLSALETRLNANGRARLLVVGNISLDADTHIVEVLGTRIDLPLLRFRLLEILMRNMNRTVSRSEIMEQVWDKYSYAGSLDQIDHQLTYLRRALTDRDGTIRIVAVPGIGYRLDCDEL